MFKTISFIGAGILLSGVLLVLGIWLIFRLTPTEAVVTAVELSDQGQQKPYRQEYEAPFEVIRRTTVVVDLALLPSISLAVGWFMGRFNDKRAWQLASASLVPILTLFLSGHSWSLRSVVISLACLSLGSIAAQGMSRLRNRAGARSEAEAQ